jgi:hypothetical protein
MGKSIEEINKITDDIVSFDMRPEDTEIYMKYIGPLPKGSVVLDIGTGQAKNVIRMALCNPEIEIWTWDWGHGNPETIPHEYFKMITERLKEKGAVNVYFTVSDSDKAWPTWDRKVDIINLDAAHDYDTTVKDLERWLPFLKSGSYFFVHDYEYRGQVEFKFEGMRKAIKEYCTSDKFEFLEYKGGTQVIKKL